MIYAVRAIVGAAPWQGKERSQWCQTAWVGRASSPERARELAAVAGGDEGIEAWTDGANSFVEIWEPDGPDQTILSDLT